MSIHEGHRQRLKERFRAEGLRNFSEINALELLLFYCVPRKDTNPIAHALLDHFGSFQKVMEAPAFELEKVPGIGHNISTFLSMIMELNRYYYARQAIEEQLIMQDVDVYGRYLNNQLTGLRNENVYLLCLDGKCRFLCSKKIGEGSIHSANIPIRRVVETALSANAASVILAHNHPGGTAVPSYEDVQTTIKVAKALEPVDIILADHIVVADNGYLSLKQHGWYDPRSISDLL